MKHDWKKATLISAVAAKNRDAANLTRHFHGGHLLRKAVRHPSWKILVIIFMWFDKGHVVINSWKIIWIFHVANSRNVDLTGKQHSRHQPFWRFPLSPWRLVADYPGHVTTHFRTQCQRPVHLKDLICDISHSMKIKYPYTKPQSPTLFISKSHPSHFCTKLWSKTQRWDQVPGRSQRLLLG